MQVQEVADQAREEGGASASELVQVQEGADQAIEESPQASLLVRWISRWGLA